MIKNPTDNKPFKNKTILLVEDDHFISKVYVKWLTLAGATVEVAFDGALGLKVLDESKVDLIILDLGMPRLNGHDTLLELKKNPQTKDIPVIVLSNTTLNENDKEFQDIKNAGVTDILQKYETSLEEIIKRVSTYFPKE